GPAASAGRPGAAPAARAAVQRPGAAPAARWSGTTTPRWPGSASTTSPGLPRAAARRAGTAAGRTGTAAGRADAPAGVHRATTRRLRCRPGRPTAVGPTPGHPLRPRWPRRRLRPAPGRTAGLRLLLLGVERVQGALGCADRRATALGPDRGRYLVALDRPARRSRGGRGHRFSGSRRGAD